MKILLPILAGLALAACAEIQSESSPRMGEPNLIIIQITGDDGAATGQVGEAFLRPSGELWCRLRYGNTSYDTTFRVSGVYEQLALLIKDNANNTGASNGDILRLNAADDPTGYLDVRPNQQFGGFLSPLGQQVSTILNGATDNTCWQWG